MRILALDFECFFDKDVSLKKLNTMEYVNNPKFKVMGCAAYFLDERTPEQIALMKLMDVQPDWYNEEEVEEFLSTVDWDNTAVLCHHVNFDAYILAQVYGIKPAFHYDTMAMSRGRFPSQSASLGALAERLFPDDPSIRKGTELASAKGIDSYSPELDKLIGGYASNDVYVMVACFKELFPTYPEKELQIIDIVTRMFTQSRFVLDRAATTKHRNDARDNAATKVSASGIDKKVLGSNDQFAAYVRDVLKLEPPMKQGKNKPIPAFGKNDITFQKLKAANPQFNHIWEARAAVKSRIDETRATRFLGATNRDGTIPMPINYYAAHTGRFGGGEKLNPQNLKRGSNLRKALQAPEGYVVVVADKSQIEARLVAWLAGCDELTQAFRDGRDVYSEFASVIYNRPIAKSDTIERFVGKTCIAKGTLILTSRGEVPIEKVTTSDRVWDGIEWVTHKGVVYQGYKDVITYQGLTATPDHGTFTADGPIPFGYAAQQLAELTRTGMDGQAIRTSESNLAEYNSPGAETEHLRVRKMYELWQREMDQSREPATRTNQRLSKLFANPLTTFRNTWTALRRNYCTLQQSIQSSIQTLRWPWNTMQIPIKDVFHSMGDQQLTTSHVPQSRDRSHKQQRTLRARKLKISHSPNANPQPKMFKEHVYDILDAGPRKRYTAANTLILNCILGLGFGVGGVKLQVTLESGSQGPVVVITEVNARSIVSKYRSKYYHIPDLWKKLEQIQVWIQNPSYYGNQYGPMTAVKEGWMMPNGMVLQYPQASGLSFYDARYKMMKKIWGGVLCENWIQALARVDICTNMCAMDDYFREHSEIDGYVALQIHDEIICICREEYGQQVYDKMYQVMTTPPHWAPDIPLKAEGGFAKEYSK